MNNVTVKEDAFLSSAKSFLKETREDIRVIERSFFTIGFRLNEAEEFEYYKDLGYDDIYSLAKQEFGFEKTTTKNLMAVNKRYCEKKEGHSYTKWIDSAYAQYKQTQLVEMLPLTPFERKNVRPDMTASAIREYKKVLRESPPGTTGYFRACNFPEKVAKEASEKVQSGHKENYAEKYFSDPEEHGRMMKRIDKLITPSKKVDDVAPGQLYLDEKESISEFHQSGGEDLIGQSTDQTVQKKTATFNNKAECLSFIEDLSNYRVILRSEELDLTVRCCEFANGIKLYRTDFKQWWAHPQEYRDEHTYSLVDKNANHSSGYYLTKPYKSYAPTQYVLENYVINWLMENKKELGVKQ